MYAFNFPHFIVIIIIFYYKFLPFLVKFTRQPFVLCVMVLCHNQWMLWHFMVTWSRPVVFWNNVALQLPQTRGEHVRGGWAGLQHPQVTGEDSGMISKGGQSVGGILRYSSSPAFPLVIAGSSSSFRLRLLKKPSCANNNNNSWDFFFHSSLWKTCSTQFRSVQSDKTGKRFSTAPWWQHAIKLREGPQKAERCVCVCTDTTFHRTSTSKASNARPPSELPSMIQTGMAWSASFRSSRLICRHTAMDTTLTLNTDTEDSLPWWKACISCHLQNTTNRH